jgi:hypothetical protein
LNKLQQRGSDRPLDDITITATNADGSAAILEIQAKRSLTFTASDREFTDVVAEMWEAAQKPDFQTIRYELAVAIARTTTRVEHDCREVLHWARQLPDGATFSAHINREKFASKRMRDFVDVFHHPVDNARTATRAPSRATRVRSSAQPLRSRAVRRRTAVHPQRPLPALPNNRAVGCGKLVIRFGVPEGKSEVSYLSQFHLLNATGRVYLNL